tara:strand:- start:222 stop:407 length:186 start_codon:yes stop_codon:yes gene_type:complete
MFDDYELLFGLLVICFAVIVVYFAFIFERKKNDKQLLHLHELMKEIKSIKTILDKIEKKIK